MVMGAGLPVVRSGSKIPFISVEAKKSYPVTTSKGEINVSNTITRYIHIKHSDSPVRIFKETTV